MNLDVEKGIIKQARIFGDFFNEKDITEVEQALINAPHNEPALREILNRFDIGRYFRNMSADDLVEAMF